MTQATTQIRELGPDDRVRVTLDDGTELRCMAQNEPDEGPPHVPADKAKGYDRKWTLESLHVEEDDGTGYETLDLSAEKRGGEWGDVFGQAWVYSEGDYVNTAIQISEVEVL
jgi:hypothetical protein